MSVTCISRLRDCGVFRDFTWPAELPTFGRYNLIYGWNWSGKTTLSRVFRAFELRKPPEGQVTLRLGQSDTTGDEFPHATLAVRVFNRDFISETVFPVNGGDVAPIFVLGEESVEKQKEVERLKKALENAKRSLDSGRLTKQSAEKALDNYCINHASKIRDALRSPGSNPYNNYNKTDFAKRALKMLADGDRATARLEESERQRLLAQQRASPKSKVQPTSYQLSALDALHAAVSQLLSSTVVSSVIESLKDDSLLSGWVHQGLKLHRDREAERCLFCQQTLPSDHLATLEAHFSTEYEQFVKKLDARIADIQTQARALETVTLPNRAELYDDLADEYAAAETTCRTLSRSVKGFLACLAERLEDKKSRAFERLPLGITVPDIDAGAVDRLNQVVAKHNQACDEFDTRIADARKRLEADSVAGDLDEFVRLRDSAQAAAQAVTQAETEIERLTQEIARLEREIVEHRRPAEELNEDLRKYLGHDELCLEVKDTGYTITRAGVPAHALSEGETTAIALLYFLKSLQDRRFELAKGVVVLDDPVSSLDANALYLAFGFIRERTQDAGQLFILTHNFTFFRQVRNWFHHLKGQGKKNVAQRPARFYMLDCTFDNGQRCSDIRPLDPLLEKYESEYHYLFARVYRAARDSAPADLEHNYALPNMARRLLETFLAFRQPDTSGELWQKLQAVTFDGPKKSRILRFVHTYSHSDAMGEPEHDLSLLGEAKAVLNDLLDLIQSQDAAHFSGMESLASPNDPGDDE